MESKSLCRAASFTTVTDNYVYWIYLAQDKVEWRAFVNTIMNLRMAYNVRDFLSG
jgi:hypothetical protein